MPSRNRRKEYYSGGYYHVYNRGVEKRKIFLDDVDYATFLKYLKEYLLPKDIDGLNEILTDPASSYVEKEKAALSLQRKNYQGRVELLVYCLMPNHFHFLIKQDDEAAMKEFLQSCMTRYTGYFNRRYKRVGPLFQERYKAVDIDTEAQFLHLSRYIHNNPLTLRGLNEEPSRRSQPSSYPVYLREVEEEWVHPEDVLGNFSKSSLGFDSYKDFVEGGEGDFQIDSMNLIKNHILEKY